jgi:hypothetical protein
LGVLGSAVARSAGSSGRGAEARAKRSEHTPEAEKAAAEQQVKFITPRIVFGAPNTDKATTYAIERSNLTARQWNARLHRRTLSFSKKLDRHCAAVALHYVYRNLCHIARNMRVTSAMAAGIADHVWTLAELMEAALAERAGEKPTPKPLAFRQPETTARPLPEGRGFLRVVGSSSGPGGPAAPPPPPPSAPAAFATPDLQLDPDLDPPRRGKWVQGELFPGWKPEKGGGGDDGVP